MQALDSAFDDSQEERLALIAAAFAIWCACGMVLCDVWVLRSWHA